MRGSGRFNACESWCLSRKRHLVDAESEQTMTNSDSPWRVHKDRPIRGRDKGRTVAKIGIGLILLSGVLWFSLSAIPFGSVRSKAVWTSGKNQIGPGCSLPAGGYLHRVRPYVRVSVFGISSTGEES